MVRLILDDVCRGGNRLVRLTTMKIAMAATGGAFDGARVCGIGVRRRHELATTVERVASQAGCMVLQAFFVGDRHGMFVVRLMALQHAVREVQGLDRGRLDPGRNFTLTFRRFITSSIRSGDIVNCGRG